MQIIHEDLLVSIIIPVYNMGNFIRKTIESVLCQTYSYFELILVDDGSTDDSSTKIQEYLSDPRVRYFYQKKEGPSSARNNGIRQSKGAIIAFLDGDDIWEPIKVEKQVQIFKSIPNVDVVYCKYHKIDECDCPIPDSPQPLPPPTNLYKALLFDNIIYGSSSSVMVRADSLKAVGGFDQTLFIGEDLELWQRLAFHHNFYCINEFLVRIRVHEKSAQANFTYFEKGSLIYINKLKTSIHPEYIKFWPQIACSNYIQLCIHNISIGNFRGFSRYLRLTSKLGFSYSLRFAFAIIKKMFSSIVKRIKHFLKNFINSKRILRNFYLSNRYKKALKDWDKNGKPIPASPLVKQQIVLDFITKNKIKLFVETGTFLGDMIEAIRWHVNAIYSIELSSYLYKRTKQRFVGVNHIHLLHGDSSKLLYELLPILDQPCVFWLDAHYSAGVTARGEKDTPLSEELTIISNHQFIQQDIILIDDARDFGKGDYPSLDEVRDWSEKLGFNTFEVKFDIIRIYNNLL
jgi:glycosyltransferase involved in cell wall biosynthesis